MQDKPQWSKRHKKMNSNSDDERFKLLFITSFKFYIDSNQK
jgi:hypothetical protein